MKEKYNYISLSRYRRDILLSMSLQSASAFLAHIYISKYLSDCLVILYTTPLGHRNASFIVSVLCPTFGSVLWHNYWMFRHTLSEHSPNYLQIVHTTHLGGLDVPFGVTLLCPTFGSVLAGEMFGHNVVVQVIIRKCCFGENHFLVPP